MRGNSGRWVACFFLFELRRRGWIAGVSGESEVETLCTFIRICASGGKGGSGDGGGGVGQLSGVARLGTLGSEFAHSGPIDHLRRAGLGVRY